MLWFAYYFDLLRFFFFFLLVCWSGSASLLLQKGSVEGLNQDSNVSMLFKVCKYVLMYLMWKGFLKYNIAHRKWQDLQMKVQHNPLLTIISSWAWLTCQKEALSICCFLQRNPLISQVARSTHSATLRIPVKWGLGVCFLGVVRLLTKNSHRPLGKSWQGSHTLRGPEPLPLPEGAETGLWWCQALSSEAGRRLS